MKKFISAYLSLAAFVLIMILAIAPLCSRTPIAVVNQPGVIMDVLDPSLEPFAVAWQTEVARRFPTNTVVVLAHGGSVVDNQWLCLAHPYSTHSIELMDDVVKDEQSRYPGRRIVLLCCNPSHLEFHNHPGVFYASGSVWCVPDRAVSDNGLDAFKTLSRIVGVNELFPTTGLNRSASEPDNCGSIFEFNEAI